MRKASMHGTIVETSGAAGIDVGKDWLDVALAAGEATLRQPNHAKGHAAIVGFLRRHGICRVGMEATGGYERGAAGSAWRGRLSDPRSRSPGKCGPMRRSG